MNATTSYLQNRNGNYHLRVRVPSDLSSLIPSTEIIKSLKTTDKKQAKVSALAYLKPISRTFTLLRLGYISSEQAQDDLRGLLNKGRGRYGSYRKSSQIANMGVEIKQVAYEPVTKEPVYNLKYIIEQYVKDNEHKWTIGTTHKVESNLKLVLDLIGNIDVKTLDRREAKLFRDKLIRLPPLIYKRFGNKTPLQVYDLIQKGSLKAEPMSITSINSTCSWFASLMLYCVNEGYITANPAVGLQIKQKKRPDEVRKAYDKEDLKNIKEKLPKEPESPERYWVPIISMYSGLRLDEVCQLYKEDIKDVEGIPCIDVNCKKDKRLKTSSSARVIPIHPKLIELGLLEYVQGVNHERLWVNLKRRSVGGYGAKFGQWYRRFNRKEITTDLQKTFHSFRHTFTDTLKQAGVQESLIAELVGHQYDSITLSRYGKVYRPGVLLEALLKLDY